MAVTCRSIGCSNELTPKQMAFCSLDCMKTYTAYRQYGVQKITRDFREYHRDWQERMRDAEKNLTDGL